ncbi:hypothetical protein PINS_up012312 [Pythium insidiosum]|nr:hypothetical protein PINS_up012312 [Pythium insidiosum]
MTRASTRSRSTPLDARSSRAPDDYALKVWDTVDGSLRAALIGHTGHVTAVAVHATLPLIASGAEDGTVRLWDAETLRCVAVAPTGDDVGRVWALAFRRGG